MKKTITFDIEESILNSFLLAVSISNKNLNDVFEDLAKYYSVSTLQKINSIAFTSPINLTESVNFNNAKILCEENVLCKAEGKIPLWASKPHQISSQIIKAYFLAEINGFSSRKRMREIFLKNNPEKTVEQFDNNLASMGTEKSHSHGHIFDFYGDEVHIAQIAKTILLQYKNKFIF